MTITLPTGTKVRTQSQRRYILVAQHADTGEAFTVKRSDSDQTLRRDRGTRGYDSLTRYYLCDTTTGTATRI